ncbi:hypothetical protein LCGC14_1728950 [marine sediment metagenome]|uniref:Uncharacterized protein n=1 Tax=marine sediment metagenome TaxID=412755 RepID=A0A0F9K9V8_9ZZZZ
MMVPKKNTKVDFKSNFPDIYDISKIRNIELFRLIIKKHPVDIYFFWRIGIKDIEKGKINNSFSDWVGDDTKKQVIMNLTKIRNRNKRIDLLEPLGRDYDPILHDIESNKIRLSGVGERVWTQAKEDGLWQALGEIPRASCLRFQDFEDYFLSHLFTSHFAYLKKIEELNKLQSFEEKRIPKRRRKEDRNKVGLYKLKEERIINHRPQIVQNTPINIKSLIHFTSTDVLRKLHKFIKYNYGNTKHDAKFKTFISYYKSSLNLPYLRKPQKAQILDEVYNRIKYLYSKGYVLIIRKKVQGKIRKYISITKAGNRYLRKRALPSKGFRQGIVNYIEKLTFQRPKSKKSTIISFFLGKVGAILLWTALFFVLIPIQETWYQREYYTPISLLYIYFSDLRFFILMSALVYSLFLIAPIHFIISIKLIRKKRWSYKIIIIYEGIIAVITSGILITNLIFLFGV